MLARDGLRVSTTHALHPWATLASAVPEEFNCSFQLGKLKVSSRLICAIRVWFLNQDCAQRLPTRFNLLKPLPSDCLDGNTNPTAPRIAQAHNMLAESMHTLPWLSTPHQKTTQKKVAVLNLILYRQPGSPVNILSRSHPVGFGCREHAVPLWLCRAGGCPSQGGNQAGNQPLAPQQPAQPSPAPGLWPCPSMRLHNGKASWKGHLVNLLATSGRVTTEAVRGLCLICGPPSNQGQVWDFSEVLK